jgi:tetratricopeptide (TPR) repeat protein
VLWFTGHPDEAVPWLEAAAAARPSGRWAHFILGNAELAARQFADAERWYRTAPKIDPTHSSAAAGLLWSLLAANRDDEARAELRSFQTGSFDGDRQSLKLADIEFFVGDRTTAVAHAKQALEEPEERYWPRGFLASTLLGAALWADDRPAAEQHLRLSERIDRARLEGGDQGYMAHVDLAAIKSTTGDAHAACESMRAAIDAGWRYSALAATDPLFENIRPEPNFAALLRSV